MFENKALKDWNTIYRKFGKVEKRRTTSFPKGFIYLLKRSHAKVILDLGCGTGRNSLYLSKLGFRVIAVDQSHESIRLLKRSVPAASKIIPMIGKMTKIPLPSKSVDGVICIKTLSHGRISDIRKTLKELRRVMRKDSFLLTDLLSKKDSDYDLTRFKKVAPSTLLGLPHEENVSHFFSNRKEIKQLFSKFKIINLEEKEIPPSIFRKDKEITRVHQIIVRK